MKLNSLQKTAKELAVEISLRKPYDVEEITTLISTRFKDNLLEFINENSEFAENKYMKLLEQQSKNKVGSKEYTKLGFQLALAKNQKAKSNRAAHCIKKEELYSNFKDFIKEKYGEELHNEFLQKYKSKDEIIYE